MKNVNIAELEIYSFYRLFTKVVKYFRLLFIVILSVMSYNSEMSQKI